MVRCAHFVVLAALVGCSTHEPLRPWTSMSYAQRLRFMEATIDPEMRRVFVDYDPHKFGGFACKTCHGASGRARGYAMPNPDLLLEPSPWNTGAADPKDAPDAMSAFMTTVSARMSALMGHGVGCFSCHTEER